MQDEKFTEDMELENELGFYYFKSSILGLKNFFIHMLVFIGKILLGFLTVFLISCVNCCVLLLKKKFFNGYRKSIDTYVKRY